MSFVRSTGVFCCCLVFAATGSSQENYRLKIPSEPSTQSSATINGDRLTITSGGSSFDYVRTKAMDSVDGKFHAYFSARARQFVRFPVAGAGNMFIGKRSGLSVDWRESQMVVEKMNASPSPPQSGTALTGPAPSAAQNVNLAHLEKLGGSSVIAIVDSDGQLTMLTGKGNRWEPVKTSVTQKLVPNSPIGLVDSNSPVPSVVTVDGKGQLIRIENGRTATALGGLGAPAFPVGSRIAVSTDGSSCFLCDEKGRLWQYSFLAKSFQNVESRNGLIAPKSDVVAFDDQVVVIGKSGNLAGYSRTLSGWSAPFLIGTGFQPDGRVASWQQGGLGGSAKALASVDKNGNPKFFLWDNIKWNPETISSVTLGPGAPIGVGQRNGQFFVSAVDKTGNWVNYGRTSTGLGSSWTPQTLANGFPNSATVLVGRSGSNAYSVDRSGRLVAAFYGTNGWNSFRYNSPFRLPRRTTQREVVRNPAIPPVEIVLQNDHRETLVVRVYDRRTKSKKYDVKIKPSASAKITVERDSGAVARELSNRVGLGGSRTVKRVIDVPPAVLYDIAVFEYKVTSQYFDRTKNKSRKPDSEQKAMVSVGMFPVPPGPTMKSGSTLSAFRLAKEQKNPGGPAVYGPIK